MPLNKEYVDYITDQFSEFDGVYSKKMFGGIGFFKDGLMFGMISSSSKFYLKVDDTNKPDFESQSMVPFSHPKMKGKAMPYWTVPTEIIEDKQLLKKWAETSFSVALKAKKK